MGGWKTGTWAFLDVESTGVEDHDKIIELGVVQYRPGFGEVSRRNWLCDPGIPIPQEASGIHGLVDSDVRGKPRIQDHSGELLDIMHDSDIVGAFNWSFDSRFLSRELGIQWDISVRDMFVVDPLAIIRLDHVGRYWQGKGRHKLGAVAGRLGIAWTGASHRAADDALMAARVMEALMDYLPDDAEDAAHIVKAGRLAERARFNNYLGAAKVLDPKDPND